MPWLRNCRTRSATSSSPVTTIPPSPVVMILRGWKLKQPACPIIPHLCPRYSAPSAQAASSITNRPWSRAICKIGFMSAGWPKRCTGMMAFVRVVMAGRICRTSTLYVARSMSTNTGVAPASSTTLAVAGKVKSGRITSSPGPMPRARRVRCNAAVPELTATACRTPTYSATFRSNS